MEEPHQFAIAASIAREGKKVRNVIAQSLRDTVLDPILVIEHDSGLKNRCYTEPALWRNSDLTSSTARR